MSVNRIETPRQMRAAATMLAERIGADVTDRVAAGLRRQQKPADEAEIRCVIRRPGLLAESCGPAEYARRVLESSRGYIRSQMKAAGDSMRGQTWRALLAMVESAIVENDDEGRMQKAECSGQRRAEYRAVERSRAGQKTVKVAL